MVRFHRGDRFRIMFGASLRAATANKPGAPAAAANPTFANVKLLVMNGDGTEGNQDMVDKGATGHTITWLGGSQMDDGIEKYLAKLTLLVDGQSDGIRIPNHADFNSFGTGDFVISSWVRPDGAPTNANQIIVAKWAGSGRRAWRQFRDTNGKLVFQASSDGTAAALTLTSSIPITQDGWSWAVTQREGNDFTQWINGIRDAAPTTDTLSIHGGGTEQVRVGIFSTSAEEFKGNFGPMRITVGEAIHTGAPATIVVPFEPHPES